MIKIFKFGGASVKDANGIRNLASVIKVTEEKKLVVVVSAMGKITNSLEVVVSNYFSDRAELDACISEIYSFHHNIITEVFNNSSHPVFSEVQTSSSIQNQKTMHLCTIKLSVLANWLQLQ